ncbi:sigma-70 family RNA polymerase sigma factor [Nakamurella flava]|uniref:Sigma-70 family RNA polymerase sigma factor n=1 Tax=Nakamurella flava TaxID=2576308 RepID=A0A4U6QG62_9ACTN|nr:sigma-70 family RNA polymerase sigma factor [Nakamurella flava]
MDVVDGRQRFRALYEEHWQALFGFACRRAETVEDAADVTSEVFLVAWRRIAEVPLGQQARLWLFGVARLTMSNHLRGERRRERLGDALLSAVRENHGDADRWFDRDESAERIRTALGKLSEADREVICLVAWEDLTPGQAAHVLGINATAARTRLSRARRRLKALLDQQSPVELSRLAIGSPWRGQS